MPKRYRQLQVKDLPKVPTRRLEWDSSLQPSGRKAPNQSITEPHNAPFPSNTFSSTHSTGNLHCSAKLPVQPPVKLTTKIPVKIPVMHKREFTDNSKLPRKVTGVI